MLLNRVPLNHGHAPHILRFTLAVADGADNVRAMVREELRQGAQVILHQLDERTTRVFVRPSFADHFVDRLTGAQQVS
jgi:sarcosine oxidase gamma subunit